MAGRDRKLNVLTGDYIADGNGSYETTTTAETAIYHQMRGDKGKWWGDYNAGNRFFELARVKSIQNVSVNRLRDVISELLQPLIDANRVHGLIFRDERKGDRIDIEATVIDSQSGEVVSLTEVLASPA
jgi:phage gp46-like protein